VVVEDLLRNHNFNWGKALGFDVTAYVVPFQTYSLPNMVNPGAGAHDNVTSPGQHLGGRKIKCDKRRAKMSGR